MADITGNMTFLASGLLADPSAFADQLVQAQLLGNDPSLQLEFLGAALAATGQENSEILQVVSLYHQTTSIDAKREFIHLIAGMMRGDAHKPSVEKGLAFLRRHYVAHETRFATEAVAMRQVVEKLRRGGAEKSASVGAMVASPSIARPNTVRFKPCLSVGGQVEGQSATESSLNQVMDEQKLQRYLARLKKRTSDGIYPTSRPLDIYDAEFKFRLIPALDRLPHGSRVLEIGIGKGVAMRRLKQLYPNLLFVGTNFYERGKNPSREKSAVKTEGAQLPFKDESFDFVFSCATWQYIPDKARFLAEVYRVLKTGGNSMLSTVYDSFLIRTSGQTLRARHYFLGHPEIRFDVEANCFRITKKRKRLRLPLRFSLKRSTILDENVSGNERMQSVFTEKGRSWWRTK